MQVIVKSFPQDTEYLRLYPIADVHYGAAECMEDKFRAYIQIIRDDPHAAVILAGDLVNNGIKSSVTAVYNEKYMPGQQKRDMIEILKPVADKIICAVPGNHELRTLKEANVDITRDILEHLGCPSAYAPDMAFLKISLGCKANRKPCTYMFLVTHGSSGGVLLGSTLNKSDAMQIRVEGVDGIISGHTHKPTKTPSGRMIFDAHNNRVTITKTLIFVCTAWLDYGKYAARKMMPPTAVHPDTIVLDGREKNWV